MDITQIEKEASAGDLEAQYKLSSLYFNDSGKDDFEALFWLKKAAETDHLEAQYKLATIYLDGLYGLKSDIEIALSWLRKSVKGKYQPAIRKLFNVLTTSPSTGVSRKEADKLCGQLIIDETSVEERVRIGLMYTAGKRLPYNYLKAYDWLKFSAQNNDIKGHYFLGKLIAEKSEDPSEIIDAIFWLRKACEGKSSVACKMLGDIFSSGHKIQQNYEQAVDFYIKAYELGDHSVLLRLSISIWMKPKEPGPYVVTIDKEWEHWFELYLEYNQNVKSDDEDSILSRRFLDQDFSILTDELKEEWFGELIGYYGWEVFDYECFIDIYNQTNSVERKNGWRLNIAEKGHTGFQYDLALDLYQQTDEVLEGYVRSWHEDFYDDDGKPLSTVHIAAYYFEKAAEAGHRDAQYYLAEIYSKYECANEFSDSYVECYLNYNIDTAIDWGVKSAKQGHSEAKELTKSICKKQLQKVEGQYWNVRDEIISSSLTEQSLDSYINTEQGMEDDSRQKDFSHLEEKAEELETEKDRLKEILEALE